MLAHFQFRTYQRRFQPPLTTSHGSWEVRSGIIVCLTDELGRVGYGEIAPISWFGSETMAQALDFCHQLPPEITEETIFSIPADLPACQFGLESAWEEAFSDQKLENDRTHQTLTYSALLPPGKAALSAWQRLWQQGYRTFKWKIGVAPTPAELEIFHLLIQALPESAKLRLDANGGLSYADANLWLWTCEHLRANNESPREVEFIEQPLPTEQFPQLLALSSYYSTPIALDESVATLNQLEACYQQGWQGIFVIKVAIAGSPRRLRQFCRSHKIDAVFSSVFETSIGRGAALKLAAELTNSRRSVGFGVQHWFEADEQSWLEQLWKHP